MFRATLVVSLATILTLILVAIATTTSSAAPRPIRQELRPLDRDDFIGEWDMLWRNGSYRVNLCRDGFYACRHSSGTGFALHGRWTYRSGKLTVSEWQVYADGSPMRASFGSSPEQPLSWTATLLPGRREGKEDGKPFSLRPVRKAKPDF